MQPQWTDNQRLSYQALFDPRPRPLPVPETGIFSEPTVCVAINRAWIPHLTGVLARLAEYDAWEADSHEGIKAAVDQVKDLMYALSTAEECGTVGACANVADCIENDADVQTTIYERGGGAAQVGQRVPPAVTAKRLIQQCDRDKIYGGVKELVAWMHGNNLDLLQQIEAQTNIVESMAILTELHPALNVLGGDNLANYINFLQTAFAENYEAQFTQGVQEELECGLFCLAGDTCELSLDQIIGYFEQRLGASFDLATTIGSFIQFMVAGTWGGTQIVDALMLAQIGFFKYFNGFLSYVGLGSLTMRLEIGGYKPSNAWELLCPCQDTTLPLTVTFGGDGYPVWEIRQGTNGVGVGTLNTVFGNGAPSVRVANPLQNGVRIEANVRVSFTNPQDVSLVAFEYIYDYANASTVLARTVRYYNTNGQLIRAFGDIAGGTKNAWHTFTDAAAVADVAYIECEISVGIINQGDGYIDNIRIE